MHRNHQRKHTLNAECHGIECTAAKQNTTTTIKKRELNRK